MHACELSTRLGDRATARGQYWGVACKTLPHPTCTTCPATRPPLPHAAAPATCDPGLGHSYLVSKGPSDSGMHDLAEAYA